MQIPLKDLPELFFFTRAALPEFSDLFKKTKESKSQQTLKKILKMNVPQLLYFAKNTPLELEQLLKKPRAVEDEKTLRKNLKDIKFTCNTMLELSEKFFPASTFSNKKINAYRETIISLATSIHTQQESFIKLLKENKLE